MVRVLHSFRFVSRLSVDSDSGPDQVGDRSVVFKNHESVGVSRASYYGCAGSTRDPPSAEFGSPWSGSMALIKAEQSAKQRAATQSKQRIQQSKEK